MSQRPEMVGYAEWVARCREERLELALKLLMDAVTHLPGEPSLRVRDMMAVSTDALREEWER